MVAVILRDMRGASGRRASIASGPRASAHHRAPSRTRTVRRNAVPPGFSGRASMACALLHPVRGARDQPRRRVTPPMTANPRMHYDEMRGLTGEVQPHYRPFVEWIE